MNPDPRDKRSKGREPAPIQPNLPSDEGEEPPHYDEAVVGRAFRWSGIALVLLGLIVGITIYVLRRPPPPPPARITEIAAPTVRQAAPIDVPNLPFTDITAASGIRFTHQNGAYGDKLLPESMGGGVAFLDFDQDGDEDLFFVNSGHWPGKTPPGQPAPTHALYRNDSANGEMKFTDVTAGSGLDASHYGMGVAVGDFDNDGWVDLFVTGVGGNRLFRNTGGGRFVDVTATAGVAGDPAGWSSSAAFADFDNDGRLDLFVCNYVKWSREIDLEVGYKLTGVGRAYGPPMNFQGTFPQLFRNEGNGRFADVSATAGIQVKNPATGVPAAKSLGVAPVDLDGDGWLDFVVANDTVQNFVFHNQKNGTFREIGALTGMAFDANGQTRGAMGIDSGRFRNDASLGIVIGNFANEMTALYVSQGTPRPNSLPLFTDEAIAEGIGPVSRLPLKFGVFFFDCDLDGRLDVLSANGHLEEEINKVQQSQQYRQPAQLFWNSGANDTSTFVNIGPEKAGADLFKPIVGRGSAFADLDGDGDLDVVLTQTGGTPLLLRNDQKLGHHWTRFRLTGRKSSRDAIGAWITVKAGDRTLARQVMPTRGYMSQSELSVTIGLGTATTVDGAEILWPDGMKQTLPGSAVKVDGLTAVEQPAS